MHRLRSPLLATLAVAAVPILAACGTDYGSAHAGGKATPAPHTSGSTVNVSLANTQFAPTDVQAKVGERITWKNTDPIAHTVTATSGARFDSGTLNQGGSFSFVAKRAGTIAYVCRFHPGMTGTITVK